MRLPYDDDVAVCPECRSEYQLHVTRCIDCGAPTRSGLGLRSLYREEPGKRVFSLPPEREDAMVVRSDALQWAESFGSFLDERGIPWRIEVKDLEISGRRHYLYSVCVAASDLDRAIELEQEHLLLENPALAAELIDLPSTDQCPACRSLISQESSECRSCGLALDEPIIDEADTEAG